MQQKRRGMIKKSNTVVNIETCTLQQHGERHQLCLIYNKKNTNNIIRLYTLTLYTVQVNRFVCCCKEAIEVMRKEERKHKYWMQKCEHSVDELCTLNCMNLCLYMNILYIFEPRKEIPAIQQINYIK